MAATVIVAGTQVRFSTVSKPFTDISGVVGDPTEVLFEWGVDGGTMTQWKYGVDSRVVKGGIGIYYADVSTTGMAANGADLLVGQFTGIGNISAINSVSAFVIRPPWIPVP